MILRLLVYHGLYFHRSEITGKPALEYVSADDFARQVRWLKENDHTLLTLSESRDLGEGAGLPEKAVCLTFDDGKRSDIRLALPTLVREKVKATFFIVPGWLGRKNIMVASEVRDLATAGMEIGSHSMSHAFLTELGQEQLQDETAGSRAFLEDLLGHEVRSFSYPYGDTNTRVRAAVEKAGYRTACGSCRGTNQGSPDWLSLSCWIVRGTTGITGLQQMVTRTSPSVGQATADLLKRLVGMRRYVGWRGWWLRRAGE